MCSNLCTLILIGTKKGQIFLPRLQREVRGVARKQRSLWTAMVWADVVVLPPTIQQVSTTHWRTHTHLTSHHCMHEASVLILLVIYSTTTWLHTHRETHSKMVRIYIALLYCHFTGLTLTTHTSGRARKTHQCNVPKLQCHKCQYHDTAVLQLLPTPHVETEQCCGHPLTLLFV